MAKFTKVMTSASLLAATMPMGKLLLVMSLLLLVQNQLPTTSAAKLGSRSFENGWFLPSNRLDKFNSDENAGEVPASSENKEVSSESEKNKTFSITVYPWNNHLGRPAQIDWELAEVDSLGCKEIPTRWQGKVRSINTNDNCVVLYSRDQCKGIFRIVKQGSPSHNRLSDICFHRKSTSVRPCNKEEKEAKPKNRG